MEIKGTLEVVAELDRLGIRTAMRTILHDKVPLALGGRKSKRSEGSASVYDFTVTVPFALLDTCLPSAWKMSEHKQMTCNCQFVRHDFGPADHQEHVVVTAFTTSP